MLIVVKSSYLFIYILMVNWNYLFEKERGKFRFHVVGSSKWMWFAVVADLIGKARHYNCMFMLALHLYAYRSEFHWHRNGKFSALKYICLNLLSFLLLFIKTFVLVPLFSEWIDLDFVLIFPLILFFSSSFCCCCLPDVCWERGIWRWFNMGMWVCVCLTAATTALISLTAGTR